MPNSFAAAEAYYLTPPEDRPHLASAREKALKAAQEALADIEDERDDVASWMSQTRYMAFDLKRAALRQYDERIIRLKDDIEALS